MDRRRILPFGSALLIASVGCSFDGAPVEVNIDAAMIPDSATGPVDAAEADAAGLPLIDRGLVVRYFIDEAESGQMPMELVDAADDPYNIPITYGDASFSDSGNRGLTWPAALGAGMVEEQPNSAKISSRIRDTTRVTIEVVVEVDQADPTLECQIAGMRGLNPDLMLSAVGSSELRLHRPFNTLAATWDSVNDGDRMVLHIVYDTTLADPERRIDLYKNGALVAKTTSNPPPQDMSLGLSVNTDLLIGNRQNQDRSIEGTIFYVAMYDVPLTPAEVATNVARLSVSDDR